jgi:RNA polymerase sigma factor (sigma-70 family)
VHWIVRLSVSAGPNGGSWMFYRSSKIAPHNRRGRQVFTDMSAYFEQLIEDHGDIVMRVLVAMVGRSDAPDCWQETFIAALKAYARQELTNPRGWLLTIAHHKALDHLRVSNRHRDKTEPLHDDVIAGTAAEAQEPTGLVISSLADADELRPALLALPPKQQHAVVYRFIGDLPYDEIAELLNCSQAAARRNVFEGLRQLRTSLSVPSPSQRLLGASDV